MHKTDNPFDDNEISSENEFILCNKAKALPVDIFSDDFEIKEEDPLGSLMVPMKNSLDLNIKFFEGSDNYVKNISSEKGGLYADTAFTQGWDLFLKSIGVEDDVDESVKDGIDIVKMEKKICEGGKTWSEMVGSNVLESMSKVESSRQVYKFF
jgi:hypothetical protein